MPIKLQALKSFSAQCFETVQVNKKKNQRAHQKVYIYIYNNSSKTGEVLIVKKGEHKKIIYILTTSFE